MANDLVRLNDYMMAEQDVLNIVEKIRDYCPDLRVKFCARPEPGDAPYIITEMCRDGVERMVMKVWTLDDRVLDRLYAADNVRNNVLFVMEDGNEKIKKLTERRFKDEMEEAHDIAMHVIKSAKGRYIIPVGDERKVVQIDDSTPEVKVVK